jgi:hypothetical protein
MLIGGGADIYVSGRMAHDLANITDPEDLMRPR